MCKSILKGQNVPGTDGTYHGTDGTCSRDRRNAHQGVSRQNSLCLLVFFPHLWFREFFGGILSDQRKFCGILSDPQERNRALFKCAPFLCQLLGLSAGRHCQIASPLPFMPSCLEAQQRYFAFRAILVAIVSQKTTNVVIWLRCCLGRMHQDVAKVV